MSHQVWSDVEKNRLYLKITKLELGRVEQFKDRVIEEIEKLKAGFQCIGDFTGIQANYELIPSDFIETYTRLYKQLIDSGMNEMIRIVRPQFYMIAMIMQEDANMNASVTYVDSMERAEVCLKKK